MDEETLYAEQKNQLYVTSGRGVIGPYDEEKHADELNIWGYGEGTIFWRGDNAAQGWQLKIVKY